MEKWKEELEKTVQATMWAMFRPGNQKANLESLEESCQMLMRMASQKTAGQREKGSGLDPKDLNWDNLYMVYNLIAIEACCLVLDPRFGELKRAWEGEDEDELRGHDIVQRCHRLDRDSRAVVRDEGADGVQAEV